ncbi:hypothetical protein [Salinibacterium sp.]|uniref:hypothetical protein n=1 Tax=Salinibacterium sp. TaxID=1915057 RepID=UPI00286BC81D|nr:hypothetical protein [Salinibacterium sp.]
MKAVTPSTSTGRRTPRYALISAIAIPVLLIGQFAMVAIVPVLLILVGALRDARIKPLRWWAALLTALYATPLVIWALRSDPAQSLSKDIHPVFVGLISAAALAIIVTLLRRRGSR